MKSFRIFAMAMVLMLLLTSVVSAAIQLPNRDNFNGRVSVATSSRLPDFTIQKVEVDGTVLGSSSALYVERASTVTVDVWVKGNDVFRQCTDNRARSCYDVKVKAFIGGYEYGEVEDVSEPFEVEPGVTYKKTLKLVIPNDIEASDDYTLRVEAFDDDQSTDDSLTTKKSYTLRLQEIRHSVNIFDTLFNPSSYVQAGQPVFVTVRAENLGDNIEDSVKVTVSVPQLGIQTQEYIDQLETSQSQRNSDRNDGFTSNDLVLMVPQDAKEGTYDVIVRLDYNRFHSFEEQKYTLHVRASQAVAQQAGTLVNVNSLAQKVEASKGAVYKLSVANLNKEAQTYTVEVTGTDGWANARVDPMTFTVQSDSTSEVNVYVAPNEGFSGAKSFSVKVKSGSNVVTEKNLSLEVTPAVANDTTKRVLTIVFVVLLLVLVLLAVIMLIKKLTEDKEDRGVEGKTYY